MLRAGAGRMRINWFSPLPPARTDIAHFSARLAASLMRRFDVVFWTAADAEPEALPPGAAIRTFESGALGREARRALFSGLNVYNLGNDARFHGAIADVARRIPGLVIAHDTRLHHFVYERARHEAAPFASYLALARSWYGEAGEALARGAVAAGGRGLDQLAERMPFIEPFVAGALGIVCHSRQAAAELRGRADAPVIALPLPFPPRGPAERDWGAPWRLVAYGYINANRRLESVLRALGRWRAPFRFDIYGTLWDRSRIESIIAGAGLAERVAIHGFAAEPQLDAAIGAAHLTFNLRYPTMGEASGGLLRSWSLATPALVTDAGWYADLPDDVARKVSPGDETADILRALTALVAHPERYRELGRAGYARLAQLHAPDRYAASLESALADAQRLFARRAGRTMLQRALASAPLSRERDLIAERACEVIPRLFTPSR